MNEFIKKNRKKIHHSRKSRFFFHLNWFKNDTGDKNEAKQMI